MVLSSMHKQIQGCCSAVHEHVLMLRERVTTDCPDTLCTRTLTPFAPQSCSPSLHTGQPECGTESHLANTQAELHAQASAKLASSPTCVAGCLGAPIGCPMGLPCAAPDQIIRFVTHCLRVLHAPTEASYIPSKPVH